MFDDVAARYDLTNDVLSLGQDRSLAQGDASTALGVRGRATRSSTSPPAPGPAREPLADAGVDVVPADFSLGMLRVGSRRRPDMPFTAADAMHLPFADASFDAVTMSFGLRNVADAGAALAGVPAGHQARAARLVVCEFSRPESTARSARSTPATSCARCRRSRAASLQPRLLRLPRRVDPGVARRRRDLARLIIQRPDGSDVAWRNLTGGIVALHRATAPEAVSTWPTPGYGIARQQTRHDRARA